MIDRIARLKVLVLPRIEAEASLLGLTFIATLAPLLRVQLLTGTVVNACLVLALLSLGKKQALAVALFPSTIAALTGTLPLPLIPLIPVIVIGNAILIQVFDFFKSRGFLTAALTSGLAKFAFLTLAGQLFLGLFSSAAVARGLSSVMSYMQLVTAMLGCLAAYCIVRLFKSGDKHAKNY